MIRFLIILGIFLAISVPSTIEASSDTAKPKLIVDGDHDCPPYEFFENGQPTGFDIELMRAVADVMGFDVEFRLGPWIKVRQDLEQGGIDALAGMYYSVERSRLVDFSVPHTMVTSGIFVRKDSPIRSFADIQGKEIIVQKGDIIHDDLRRNGLASRIVAVREAEQALKLLASGKHDCTLMPSRLQGAHYVKTFGLANIKTIKTELPQLQYCFAVRKGDQELLYQLDEGLKILKVNGKYREIYEKWFGVYEERGLWETAKYYVVIGFAVFMSLIVAGLLWSRSLQIQVRIRTAELRESEEKFRVLAETSPAAICVYQGEHNVYFNTAMTRLIGYTDQECLEMKFWDWTHPEYKEVVRERGLARQRGELVSSRYEFKCLTKNGDEKWLFLSAGRIEYKGKPAGIVTLVDISDRKRMEDELKQAHFELEKRVQERTAELRNANELLEQEITVRKRMEEELLLSHFCINEAAIGIVQISLDDGKILRVNEYVCRSLGYSSDELRATTIFDIDSSISKEKFADLKRIAGLTGSVTFESNPRRKDGTAFPIEVSANILEFQGVSTAFTFFRDITERKQAEEALRESESRVRRKLESIIDPEGDTGELDLADILDTPGIQALIDDLFRMTGLKMSIIDLRGRVLADVGWQDICSKFHRNHPETLKRCLESDTDLTVGIPQGEFRTYRCKNNMWHLVTPIIVGGKHMGNLFLGQFFFVGEELDYDLFRAQARQYGFPEEEYIAALEAVPRHSEELVNLGKAVFLRLTDMISKLSYANIKLAHSLAERDQLTAVLRQANMVVENSPVVLFRWKGNEEWPVELVSANIIQFGYTPEVFLSGAISYSSIIHPDDLERVTREVHDYCDGGADQFRLEYRIMTKGGDVRWINEHSNVERDAAGGVVNFEGIVIDVTERKLFEEELQRQKKLLRELNETLERRVGEEVAKNREKDIMLIQQNRQAAMGDLLEHIAHQWKQPLTVASLLVQNLWASYACNELTAEKIQETIDKTTDLLEHMAQTIEVFRDFYRPDKEKTVFCISDSVDNALAFISPELKNQSIAVELDVDPGLLATGYPREYIQVLLNVLSNARDALRDGKTEKPKIMIKGIAEGNRAVVTIADNAGGIPEPMVNSIFDLYVTTKEASGGTGIGLHMSKNIIEKNMDGSLTAHNTDSGAQFKIALNMPN
jgi:PAS domain S-box-containing protein